MKSCELNFRNTFKNKKYNFFNLFDSIKSSRTLNIKLEHTAQGLEGFEVSDLVLFCLLMSHKKDAKLTWIKNKFCLNPYSAIFGERSSSVVEC